VTPPVPLAVPAGYRVLAYADGIGHLVKAGRSQRLYRICDGHSMAERFAWPSRVRCGSCQTKAEVQST
jgi:hypothetical protein